MKKNYITPSINIININAQEMIALSNFDNKEGTQNINNAEIGSGSEELGAGGYRSGLWN